MITESVRSTGFGTWVNSRIHLDVGNQLQINVPLHHGVLPTPSVEVSTQNRLVCKQTKSRREAVVSEKEIGCAAAQQP